MLIAHMDKKFNMASSNGSFVIGVKPKDKRRFRMAAILVCILNKITPNKTVYFLILTHTIPRIYINQGYFSSHLKISHVRQDCIIDDRKFKSTSVGRPSDMILIPN